MAKAALPILGSIIGPSLASAMGLGISPLLMSAIGGGLGSWAATGKPLAGLEGAGLGLLTGGLMGGGGLGSLFGGGGGGAAAAYPTLSDAAMSSVPALAGMGMSPAASPALASAIGGAFSPAAGLASNFSAVPDLAGMAAGSASPELANAVASNYLPGAMAMQGMGGLPGIGASIPPGAAMMGYSSGLPAAAQAAVAGAGGPMPSKGGGGLGGMSGMLKNPMSLMMLAAMGGGLGGNGSNGSPAAATAFKSPGLTPYQTQHWVAPPAGYVPGISPEPYMLSNPGGFAGGGPVHGLSMIKPPQMIRAPMLSPTRLTPPASNYAGHAIMHMAMSPRVMAPTGSSFPTKFDAGGDVSDGPDPSMAGGIGGMPGLAVPPGTGDGQSDSVPATIDGQAPALLSSGEHVIPSDVVSHLGNGDTAAGHRALHGMTARVRAKKTGNTRMPPKIGRGVMPA